MKQYTLLNEDFFDDKEEILQNIDDIDSIKTEYEHTVIIWLSISNYAATNENVFASVLKSFENRVSAFFNSCRFIRDFSDFTYKQNSIKEDESTKIIYGGYSVTVDGRALENKNYINSLEISVDVDFNCKTARDCYKFIKFFGESQISNKYAHISNRLSIKNRNSINEYTMWIGLSGSVDFTEWQDVADTTYEICVYMFGDDYKYGTMLKELHKDNLERMCANHFFNNETFIHEDMQDRIIFIGRFEKINVCSLPDHWSHKRNTPYANALGFYTIDGFNEKTMGSPWDPTSRNLIPKLKEFLENTPVYLYILKTEVDGLNVDEVIGIYEGTYVMNGEEYVLALQTGPYYTEAALASFVSPEKAKELHDKYINDETDDETDDEDEDDEEGY